MQKKKTIVLAILLLIGAVALLWVLRPSQPQVVGDVPANDLAKIERVVHDEIWRGTLPDYSWRSFKGLPAAIRERISNRIRRIEMLPGGGVVRATITTGKHRQAAQLQAAYYDLILRNGPKGWEIVQPIGDIGPFMMRGF